MTETDVLVVGAGPTGLAAANLLGSLGVRVRVVEREPELVREPRAVSIDDDAARLLQVVGLSQTGRGVVHPGTGTQYFGADRELLAYGRGEPLYGHPVKSPIDHQEFCRFLCEGALRYTEVEFGTALVGLQQVDDAVICMLESASGGPASIRARFVLACDGGRSEIREQLLGLTMHGASLREPWLVVDTVGDTHDERYALHFGDPDRPHVIVPGPNGRCRYEFRLRPGEDPAYVESLESVRALLADHRPRIEADEIVRSRVYEFHALTADRWRVGNVMLLGDAAHMMPPFAAQGLNSGLRDAANLGWKIAAVLRGLASPALLDTYEQERRPHTEATIAFSVRLGSELMTTSHSRARRRDRLLRLAERVPALRRFTLDLRGRPMPHYTSGCVIDLDGHSSDRIGVRLPQPDVLLPDDSVAKLDALLGPWFALVAIGAAGDALERWQDPAWEQLGVQKVALDLDDRFPHPRAFPSASVIEPIQARAFARYAGQILLVRPDRFVAAVSVAAGERSIVAALQRLAWWPAISPRCLT